VASLSQHQLFLSLFSLPFIVSFLSLIPFYSMNLLDMLICLCIIALCRIYEGLTNCTYQVAMRMDCFWPNQIVDRFFMQIHQTYFQDCALTGRLLHDPAISVLAPFIAVPVLVTLKRTEGVL
uniref:Receptor activity-modifying protein 1 n=1 Tax=Amphiprion percula TaxID=161767 RepID=A0A3P8RPC6_AMPPE